MIRCLLIDDDSDDQEFFRIATRSVGFDVDLMIAESGIDALDLLDVVDVIPDCVFLDLNMPKMNGREFLKKIKSMDILKEIPVLIYSTSKEAKDKTDMILLGATQFITKPNSIAELTTVLKREFAKISVRS